MCAFVVDSEPVPQTRVAAVPRASGGQKARLRAVQVWRVMLVCCVGVLGAQPAHAADAASPRAVQDTAVLTPGDYGAGGNRLTITSDGPQLRFVLFSVGENGHTCDFKGTIRRGVAVMPLEDPSLPRCVLKFTRTPHGVEVEAEGNGHGCYLGGFCAVRGRFEGLYPTMPSGCRPDEVGRVRARFKQAYDGRNYAAARAVLEPLLRCEQHLHDATAYGIRNDLAVTLYHLQDKQACLAALDPMREIAEASEGQVREDTPSPAEQEMLLAARRAARTNLALCRRLK